tara:strand:+ start:109 stop:1053 length:945 start_codon:yes stop_codon:yes gene_type:complete
MSSIICSCGNPTMPNLGRPDCVIEMKALAFPIIVPRYKADGVTRNSIDLTSATLGADIKALILSSTALLSRIYPFPRCENITFERTDTVYETAPSTRKYKINGVGGVRTFKFETWGKDAVHQILRELKKIGCSDVDFYLTDVGGSLWGIKDKETDTIIRGYEMATETYDSFKEYATDTTTQKAMISWDLNNNECEENSYAITAEELGYSANSLRANISGTQVVTALTNTTLTSEVITGFGTAGARDHIIGLLTANFTVENTDVPAGDIIIPTIVENPDGTYTITTSAMTAGEAYKVTVINAAGYDVANGTFTAV